MNRSFNNELNSLAHISDNDGSHAFPCPERTYGSRVRGLSPGLPREGNTTTRIRLPAPSHRSLPRLLSFLRPLDPAPHDPETKFANSKTHPDRLSGPSLQSLCPACHLALGLCNAALAARPAPPLPFQPQRTPPIIPDSVARVNCLKMETRLCHDLV